MQSNQKMKYYKPSKEFLSQFIPKINKVRHFSTRDLAHEYFFGEYKKNLNINEKKTIRNISMQMGIILNSYCMKKYPDKISRISNSVYKFIPLEK